MWTDWNQCWPLLNWLSVRAFVRWGISSVLDSIAISILALPLWGDIEKHAMQYPIRNKPIIHTQLGKLGTICLFGVSFKQGDVVQYREAAGETGVLNMYDWCQDIHRLNCYLSKRCLSCHLSFLPEPAFLFSSICWWMLDNTREFHRICLDIVNLPVCLKISMKMLLLKTCQSNA